MVSNISLNEENYLQDLCKGYGIRPERPRTALQLFQDDYERNPEKFEFEGMDMNQLHRYTIRDLFDNLDLFTKSEYISQAEASANGEQFDQYEPQDEYPRIEKFYHRADEWNKKYKQRQDQKYVRKYGYFKNDWKQTKHENFYTKQQQATNNYKKIQSFDDKKTHVDILLSEKERLIHEITQLQDRIQRLDEEIEFYQNENSNIKKKSKAVAFSDQRENSNSSPNKKIKEDRNDQDYKDEKNDKELKLENPNQQSKEETNNSKNEQNDECNIKKDEVGLKQQSN